MCTIVISSIMMDSMSSVVSAICESDDHFRVAANTIVEISKEISNFQIQKTYCIIHATAQQALQLITHLHCDTIS
jgi:hypothetical protein